MGQVLPLHKPPYLQLTERGWIDVACLELACAKLPTMKRDESELGRDQRALDAAQIEQGLLLHARLWERMADERRFDALRLSKKGGARFSEVVTSDYIVHRVQLSFQRDTLWVEGFDFKVTAGAPAEFRLYRMLSNLSLVALCPYEPFRQVA